MEAQQAKDHHQEHGKTIADNNNYIKENYGKKHIRNLRKATF